MRVLVVHAAQPSGQDKSEGHKARFVVFALFLQQHACSRQVPQRRCVVSACSTSVTGRAFARAGCWSVQGSALATNASHQAPISTASTAASASARDGSPRRPGTGPPGAAKASLRAQDGGGGSRARGGSATSAPRCESKMAAAAGQPCGTAPAGEGRGRGGFP